MMDHKLTSMFTEMKNLMRTRKAIAGLKFERYAPENYKGRVNALHVATPQLECAMSDLKARVEGLANEELMCAKLDVYAMMVGNEDQTFAMMQEVILHDTWPALEALGTAAVVEPLAFDEPLRVLDLKVNEQCYVVNRASALLAGMRAEQETMQAKKRVALGHRDVMSEYEGQKRARNAASNI